MALITLAVLVAWAAGTRRRAAAGVVALAALVLVAVDAAWGAALLARVTEIWTTRIPIWVAAARMFGDAPVLGNGPRSFGVLFTEYSAHLALPDWLPSDMKFSPWAHDLYLETLAEQGVVGLAALLALLFGAGRAALRLVRSSDDETRRLGAGVALGLGALCLAGIFELTLLRLWMVVVLFALVGAAGALAREPAESAAPSRPRSGGGDG